MTLQRLHPDDLAELADLTARRLAELLQRSAAAPELVTATQVAQRFGVSPAWVREHADRLGVIRLGDGARPRLRFDVEHVAAALRAEDARGGGVRSQAAIPAVEPSPRRRKPRPRSGDSPGTVLPIRGTRP